MGRCPNSRIEFSTMYKHGYGDNTFQSRVFPYRTDTSLVVEDLELLILNQRFNDISAQDDVRVILLYILNQGFFWERSLMKKSLRNICGWWRTWINGTVIANSYKLTYIYYKIWIWEMFPSIRGNGAIRQNYLYPCILRWFHIKRLTWEKVCDLFDVDQDEAHQSKRKMIASDVEASTPHYLSYISSLNCELSEAPSSLRYNFRNDGASSSKTSWGNSQSSKSTERTHTVKITKKTAREIMARLESLEEEIRGMKNKGGTRDGDDLEQFFNDAFDGNEDVVYSPQKSNPVNEDDQVEEEKKEVVARDIVDAENHIPIPIVKEGRPVRQLKPSQYFSCPYVSHVDLWGGLLNDRRPNDARWTIMSSSFFGGFEMFRWAGSATRNPFDPLDGCKSWLEVDRVYVQCFLAYPANVSPLWVASRSSHHRVSPTQMNLVSGSQNPRKFS
ncbi:unnamed protein product [Lactuca saligna]|uniref:Uncharacterized protein n=1 Tax=Lactuca saligna TaxID=75948 RepID=A0AA35VLQ1_LACSI|nr:unnamed protein product [Lactuca saligna]